MLFGQFDPSLRKKPQVLAVVNRSATHIRKKNITFPHLQFLKPPLGSTEATKKGLEATVRSHQTKGVTTTMVNEPRPPHRGRRMKWDTKTPRTTKHCTYNTIICFSVFPQIYSQSLNTYKSTAYICTRLLPWKYKYLCCTILQPSYRLHRHFLLQNAVMPEELTVASTMYVGCRCHQCHAA